MKKHIAMIISLMLVFTMTNLASAASIESLVAGVGVDTSRTVSVTVKYQNPEDAQESTLLVVKKDVSIVTAKSSDLRYIAQKEVIGNTVTYSFKMAESDRTGTYDLYIGGTKIDAPESTTISFDYNSATTINFVDKADTSVKIAASVLVNANIGESIDLSVYAPDIIEYDSNIYRKDSSNPASYTVEAAENVVNVLYAVDDIETIDTVSATVIGSNLPVLPTTITATTKGGTSTTVTVTEWDLSNLTEGEENTVYGTVWGSKLKAEAKVTVLPESFSLSDTSSKGSADNNIYFPANLADEFYIEFDMVINTVSDTGANFGYNGSKWGSGAFGISPNGGNLKATGGNKTGTSDGGTVLKSSVKAGETYRILVKADASTDTFSVYATGSDGTVGKAENKTFRKEQSPDCVNTINLRGNGAADGDLEIRNVKVYSNSYVKAKFVNDDGEVIKEAVGDVSGGSFTVEGKEIFAIHSDGTGAFYNIPETYVTEHTTVVVDKVDNKYAVNEDAFIQAEVVYGIGTTNTDSVFVGAAEGANRGPLSDADGLAVADGTHTPSTLGSYRVGFFEFPVIPVGENEAVMAHFYVRTWHGNTFSNSNNSIRLAAYAVNDSSWTKTEKGSYTPSSSPILTSDLGAIFSKSSTNAAGYITFDVTEAIKTANSLGLGKLSFKLCTAWGGAYIAEREAAVEGGTYEGKAAYVEIVSANAVSVSGANKVTKMGTDISAYADSFTVPEGETIKVYTEAPYVTDDTTVYTVTDGVLTLTPSASAAYRGANVGVSLIEGAQVRIGDGVDENGKIPENGGSGLRFIATVDNNESLASIINATFGVEIMAEGDEETVVDIKATKWQKVDEVFTAALTNLAESNYNRKFTAKPYVEIGGNRYYGNLVTRSIYQVAAGLLTNGNTDGTDYDNSAIQSEILYKVLNAYVNQTGIRLTWSDIDADDVKEITIRTDGTGSYTGDAFFEVSETTVDGTKYTVTLTPVGTNTKINTDYWNEYVRINNNNSRISVATTLTDNGDGTYTLTFDTSKIQ
ncbi:MAG: hypothetical protein ACI3XA_00150 [Clostridia bacterium]